MKEVIAQTELDSLIEILANNQDKNLVQRIINKSSYPVLKGKGEFEGKVHTQAEVEAKLDKWLS